MQLERQFLDLKYAHLRAPSPARLEKLVASIAKEGQHTCVLVVAGEPGRHVVIDGYQRLRALELLHRDTVEASVLELSESEALVWAFSISRGAGRSAIEEAWLLQELHVAHGMSLGELGQRFGRSSSWVSRRLGLVGVLPESAEQWVRAGNLSPHAAMKYLVPLARANGAHCAKLATALCGDRVSVRELERLYAAWRAGDSVVRERIVTFPRLFLDAAASRAVDPTVEVEDAFERVVIRDLNMAGAIGRRVDRGLQARKDRGEGVTTPSILRAWNGTQAAMRSVESWMTEVSHAGS